MNFTVIVMLGVLFTIGIYSFDSVFAQSLTDPPLMTSFTTQKSSYVYGDTIIISGNIDKFWPNEPVHLTLYLPNGMSLDESEISIDANGDFTYQIKAGGQGWIEEGMYSVYAAHVVDAADPLLHKTITFEYSNLTTENKKLLPISKQLDSETQREIDTYDLKISREKSQYDEYFKQYQYYEQKLSEYEDPKFSQSIKTLDSLDQKINSLIEQRNSLLSSSQDMSQIEEKIESKPNLTQVETKPQAELFCFLFWCW